jgi:hypothetical protein
MHSNRPRTCEASTASSGGQATDLRVYLDQLINSLDETSLRATLKLMICERRGAIHKQQGLIALERLGGRNTAGRLDQLRELKTVQDQLVAVYASYTDAELDVAPEGSLHGHQLGQANKQVRSALMGVATRAAPCSFTRPAGATTKQEQQVYVGRIVGGKPQEDPVRAERAAGRDRQSRHGPGAAR